MVSVAGYSVEMFLLWTMMTYVLIVMFTLARVVVAMIAGEYVRMKWFQGVPAAIVLGLFFLVSVWIVYSTPVRIGLIMFLNGFLTALIAMDLRQIVVVLRSMRGVEYGSEDSGEGTVQG